MKVYSEVKRLDDDAIFIMIKRDDEVLHRILFNDPNTAMFVLNQALYRIFDTIYPTKGE